MLNRLKQFYIALTAKISYEDMKFIDEHLNEFEKELFMKLSVYEQKHSIYVAKDTIEEYKKSNKINNSNNRLIKAALLHDIGKVGTNLNIIERSLLVIFNKISKGKMKKINIRKIQVYYNHGNIGYELLKSYNYDEKFLYLIKNHHNKYICNIESNEELRILMKCDEIN